MKDTCVSIEGLIIEAEIHSLLVIFYTPIRSRDLPSAILETHLRDDWDGHVPKIWDIWSSILLAKRHFRGNPLIAHQGVPGITRKGFDQCLSLFEEVASAVLNSTHALDVVARAPRMLRASRR